MRSFIVVPSHNEQASPKGLQFKVGLSKLWEKNRVSAADSVTDLVINDKEEGGKPRAPSKEREFKRMGSQARTGVGRLSGLGERVRGREDSGLTLVEMEEPSRRTPTT
ncbi:hypothetical protein M9H77_22473 [Catharanthus roseus]|uniref:Uncharacterized protein n=1 Tax=Catharanthus roseus TaxID=4058 RepID=A0ACC0AS25_CATRO|nr:hypothetical protein M9H77_22473 [Catharanthus roseus]